MNCEDVLPGTSLRASYAVLFPCGTVTTPGVLGLDVVKTIGLVLPLMEGIGA